MKRIFALLLALALLPAGLQAREIDEGIDYQVLTPALSSDPAEGKVEVMEIFWYGCPHCYHLEPRLKAWLAEQGDRVQLVRRPSALNPSWEIHARAYYAAQALDAVEKLHGPLFRAIHEERRRLNNEDELAKFAAEQGIDEQAFRNAFRSFYVETNVRRERLLNQRGFLNGVPAIVINGKYFADTTISGGYDGLIEVMSHLVEKELQAR